MARAAGHTSCRYTAASAERVLRPSCAKPQDDRRRLLGSQSLFTFPLACSEVVTAGSFTLLSYSPRRCSPSDDFSSLDFYSVLLARPSTLPAAAAELYTSERFLAAAASLSAGLLALSSNWNFMDYSYKGSVREAASSSSEIGRGPFLYGKFYGYFDGSFASRVESHSLRRRNFRIFP